MARWSRHPLLALAGVVCLTLPWLGVRGAGLVPGLPVPVTILTSGVAVIGAAFVLTWAAETAEMDVPRSFALAVLAIIAVAPEYAVDALYAWEAGGSGDARLGERRQPRGREYDRREPDPGGARVVAHRAVRDLPG